VAAITSCTNTSNPSVMVGAGILARKAVERGLSAKPWVKTSLAPGSQVVTEYLNAAGLTPYLDQLGFNLVGYGCTTCIGNSGPLPESIEGAVQDNGFVVASILGTDPVIRSAECGTGGGCRPFPPWSSPLIRVMVRHGDQDSLWPTAPIPTAPGPSTRLGHLRADLPAPQTDDYTSIPRGPASPRDLPRPGHTGRPHGFRSPRLGGA